MPKAVLELKNVVKSYQMGERTLNALEDLSLTILENDFISIVGPSGSGKSTLLHILGLLDSPTSGKVYVDGIETSKLDDDSKAKVRGKKIGFVFQTFNLIPSLTALENVALPMSIYGVSKKEREAHASKILGKLGMETRLHHFPNQLSGGQRQRVAIARSLVNTPEIILADEPTGNLDSKTGAEVLGILSDLHKEGKTIVIITHDNSITRVTKRTIRIKDGRMESKEV